MFYDRIVDPEYPQAVVVDCGQYYFFSVGQVNQRQISGITLQYKAAPGRRYGDEFLCTGAQQQASVGRVISSRHDIRLVIVACQHKILVSVVVYILADDGIDGRKLRFDRKGMFYKSAVARILQPAAPAFVAIEMGDI